MTSRENPEAPFFEVMAEDGINIVREIFQNRGNEYGDSWHSCGWNILRNKLSELCPMSTTLTDEHLRIIALAAFVDMKHARHHLRPHPDNLIDLAAYALALVGACEDERKNRKDPPKF